MSLRSSNINRLPSTGVNTNGTFALGTAVFQQFASVKALKDTAGIHVLSLGPTGGERGGERLRSAIVNFFGTGSDNTTFDYRAYVAHVTTDDKVVLRLLGSGTATLSTFVGVASSAVADTERFADTLTWTEGAYNTKLRAVLGAAASDVDSPADNSRPATLVIADTGGGAFLVFDFDLTGATGCGVIGEAVV